jgi:hypothetical protein
LLQSREALKERVTHMADENSSVRKFFNILLGVATFVGAAYAMTGWPRLATLACALAYLFYEIVSLKWVIFNIPPMLRLLFIVMVGSAVIAVASYKLKPNPAQPLPQIPPVATAKPDEKPSPPQKETPKENGSSEIPKKLYALSVGAALQSTGLIWGVFNAPPSGALAPVNLILAMSVTNLQDKKAMLKRISLETKTPHGWMLLRRLPSSGFTWVAALQNEFTHAQKLRIQPEDITIPLTDRNLDAGETITGLGVFEYEDRAYVVKSGEPSKYRVTIVDFAGNKDVIETSPQEDLQANEDKYSMIGGSVSIANTGESMDISNLPIRWFLPAPKGSTPTGAPSSLLITGYEVPAIDMLGTKVRAAIHLFNEGPDPMKLAFRASIQLIERCVGIDCVHDECGKLWNEFKSSPEWNRNSLNVELPIHTPVREELSQGFYLTDEDAKKFENNDNGTLLFVMGVINITDKSGTHSKEFSIWMSGDRQPSLCPDHNN